MLNPLCFVTHMSAVERDEIGLLRYAGLDKARLIWPLEGGGGDGGVGRLVPYT